MYDLVEMLRWFKMGELLGVPEDVAQFKARLDEAIADVEEHNLLEFTSEEKVLDDRRRCGIR